MINGYKSSRNNFTWTHFDGTPLKYLGKPNYSESLDDLRAPGEYEFATFRKGKVSGKQLKLTGNIYIWRCVASVFQGGCKE